MKYAAQVIDPKLKLLKLYDECCNLLHFSSSHMSLLGGVSARQTELDKNQKVQFKIGSQIPIPVEVKKQMIQVCIELATGLGKVLNMAIDEKNKRSQVNKN